VALTGPVLASRGERRAVADSHGGYAALGQLIADVTGLPYPGAIARLVLEPLGMDGSAFPARWPDAGAVTGYTLGHDGAFEPGARNVCTVQASGGLWTTAGDLVRFGLGWASLLPGGLARDALRPQAGPADRPDRVGLGWVINSSIGAAGHAGRGPGTSASLITRMGSGRAYVALANRSIPVEPVNGRVVRATAGPDDPPMDDVVSDRSA
jgi:CubicO group peptidase (beta-lactamase class C family)